MMIVFAFFMNVVLIIFTGIMATAMAFMSTQSRKEYVREHLAYLKMFGTTTRYQQASQRYKKQLRLFFIFITLFGLGVGTLILQILIQQNLIPCR